MANSVQSMWRHFVCSFNYVVNVMFQGQRPTANKESTFFLAAHLTNVTWKDYPFFNRN